MNLFEKIIYFLKGTMERPVDYGWFHWLFIILAIALTIVLCVFFRNTSDKVYRRIMLISWLVMVVLEIYKQIIFSFDYNGTTVTWSYSWYAFPFQFCSSPIYILPFVIFLKNEKIRKAFIYFICTFSMFAGITVFIYPNGVFCPWIGINIQTMVHHGLQIVLGIYTAVYYRKELSIIEFTKSIAVFAGLCLIALGMNLHMNRVHNGTTFNMYYISPYFECSLPILHDIYLSVPYVVFLLIYILGFAVCALIMWAMEFGITKLTYFLIEKKNAK